MSDSEKFCELWAGGPLFAQAGHFKLGTDSVLLSDFVNIASAKRGIDLGCASGAIMLLLLARSEKLCMTGLEIVPDAAALANENLAVNSLDSRGEAVNGDIRRVRELFRAGSYDLVVSNPPYFPVGSGAAASGSNRAGARAEADCTLDDICSAAEWLLRTGGSFTLVHRPERLSEVFSAICAHGMEPKRLRTVHNRAALAPSLVLIEAKRGGHPGLRFEAPLILTENDGSESAEYRRIYHR